MSEIRVCSGGGANFVGGVSATDAIVTGGEVKGCAFIVDGGTSSEFLKADGTTDSATYTTCLGDITGVTAGDLLSGGGLTGSVTLGIDSGALTPFDQSGCAGLNCIGTVTASSTDTFTNKSGNISQWTNNSGYTTCLGDVTGVTDTAGLSTSGTSGDICIGIDAATAAGFDQSGCAGIDCVGTITGVTANNTLTGDVVGGNIRVGVDASCVTKWDTAADGDISAVTTGVYLTGGGTSGSVEVGIDSACASKWDTAATGGVQSLSAGDGLLDNGTGTDPNIAVDSTVVRTSGDQTIAGEKTFTDDLRAEGDTDASTFYVSGSADSVGIGTDTPGEKLTVVGNVEVEAGEFIGDIRGAVNFLAQAGENISAGEAVYISGISGNTTVVSLADADVVGEYPAFGIAEATATTGNPITIVQFGDLAGLNTSQWGTEGTELYIGTTAGELVSAAPTGEGAALQKIAKITRAHASTGSITIMGAGRSNAVPNLDNGNIFIGDGSNTPTTASFDACLCATADTRYIQGVTTSGGVSGGGSTGTVDVALDASMVNLLNQSGCAGINCIGDITGVTDTSGLSTSGTSGTICIGLDASTAASLDQSGCAGINCVGDVTGIDAGTSITVGDGATSTPSVSITTACNTEFKGAYTTAKALSTCPGLDCVGTITSVGVSDGLETTGGTSPTLGIDTACNTKWDQSGCTGLNCIGDITGVTDTSGLSTSGTSGTICIGIDAATAANFDQSGCAGINCVGTTTASNSQTFTNKSGSNSQWTNDEGYTTCTGDITNVTAGNALSGGGGSGSVTLGVDATSAANWDQSGCAGLNCVGTTTASNSQTFTNKSGSNNQWTNDAGYTTCTGDVTNVTNTAGLSTSGTSGTICIGLAATTAASLDQSGCAGIDCVGTITSVGVSDGLETTGGTAPTLGIATACNTKWDQSGCAGLLCTGTTTASNTQTFTNKSGSNSQWTNDEGYTTCVGDVTNVTNTAGLSTSGSSGNICIGLDATTAASLDQSSCAGINCVGTTTASNTQTFTNKSGSNNQWTNDAGYTTCLGTVTSVGVSDGLETTGGTAPTLGIATACNTKWDQSGCSGLNCVGDITGVTDTSGLSTSGTSGTICIGIDATTAAGFDQSGCAGINCVGDITGVTAGDGLANGGTSGTVTVDVDSTVARTNAAEVFDDNVTVQGDLIVNGDFTCINTVIETTSAITVTNHGTGPALDVDQAGANDIVNFKDDGASAFFIENGGNVGINCTNPAQKLDVSGTVQATTLVKSGGTSSQFLKADGSVDSATYTTCVGDVTNVTNTAGLSTSGSSGNICIGLAASTANSLNQAGCAGLLCTGTTTASNTQTFTNKSGSNNQWTNDAGYTTCTGTVTTVGVSDGLETTGGTAPTLGIATACNTKWDQSGCAGLACVGDITGVTAGNALSGGSTSGTATLGVDATSAANWDQSGCAGLNCVGTTTASNSQTFTNKSGSNNQWTNDAGYTTCIGDVTNVTNTAGLSTSGTSGTICIGLDATTAASLDQSGCAGINCTGTVTSVGVSDGLETTGGTAPTLGIATACNTKWDQSGCAGLLCTGTTTASNTQTFTNKSGSNNQWTNDAGYTTCTGDITNVTAGNALSGGGGSGSVTLGVDATSAANWDQSGCAGLLCTGTTTASNSQTFTNKSGSNNQWTNDAGYTTCTGTVTTVGVSDGLETTGGTAPTLGIATACNTKWDQSGCSGLNCVGDITGVTDTAGLSTSGSSGNICIGLDATTAASLDQSGCAGILCVGDITGVTAGTLLDGGGTSGSVTLNVDLSELPDGTGAVVTNTDEIVYLDAGVQKRKLFDEIFGTNAYNSTAFTTCLGTVTSVGVSDGLETTGGTAPTLGIATACNTKWDQSGCAGLACVGDITGVTDTHGLSTSGTSGNICIGLDATTANSLNQAGCAGLLCTGTTTASNSQTFTNKSGSNNQWTNDAGYTTCTGTVTTVGVSDGLETTGGTAPTLGIATTCNTKWDQSGCAGLDCVGDVTNVTNTAGLSTSGTAGVICIGLAASTAASLDQSGCAGIDCVGTTTASNVQLFTNKTGCISQWTNDDGYTTCTGTTTPSNSQTFTNKGGNISQWANDTGYTTCTGDITGVTTSGGISGGSTSGSAAIALDGTMVNCLNQSSCPGINCVGTITGVGVSTGLATTGGTSPTLCIDATCNSTWNGKTTCLGTVTSVTGGTGVTSTGGTTPSISTCFDGDISQKIITTGGSICLGACAGKSITEGSGIGNIAIGACAGCTVTTGDGNLAVGKQALQNNLTGSRNVGIGDTAGFNITGSDNLVFGRAAGCGITSGICNVAIGNYAGRTAGASNTGNSNVAIGTFAQLCNASGNCNVAIGFCAMQNNNTGAKNVAVGPCALGQGTTAITGNCNVAIGEATAWKNTTGSQNIAMGFVALGCNCTGSCNIAIGYTAGRFTGTGTTQMQAPTNSIFIGNDAGGGGGSSTTNEVAIGTGTVGCGANTMMLGNASITVVCSNGTFSTVSDIRDKTCICDIELGLDFIGDLKPKTFNMITDRDDPEGSISCKRHGFIAQEVLALEGDDNVIIRDDNPERLGYTGELIIPILVKAVQELEARVKELEG